MGFQSKKEKCSHKFLKYSCMLLWYQIHTFWSLSHLWGWVVGDMQKGVQKTEEMLVKVKQYFSGSSCVQHLAHLTSIILTGKHNHWYWRSGFGPNGGQVMLSSKVVDQTKPLFRLQPPADGRPYYLVKNSLSSLIKEVEGSRSVLKVKSFQSVQIDLVQLLRCVWEFLVASVCSLPVWLYGSFTRRGKKLKLGEKLSWLQHSGEQKRQSRGTRGRWMW